MGLLSNGNFPMRLVQMKRVMHLERWMFFTETFLSFFTKISGTFGLNCEFYPQTRKLKHRVRILDGESLWLSGVTLIYVFIFFLSFFLGNQGWTGGNILFSSPCFQVWPVQSIHAQCLQFWIWFSSVLNYGDVILHSKWVVKVFI